MSPHPAVPLGFSSAFTAEQAVARGISLKALQHRVRSGEIVRLRRGVYAPARELDPSERIQAALLTAPTGCAIAYEAAAVVHGIPIPHSFGLRRVDLYVALGTPSGGGRPPLEVRLHYVDVPQTQLTRVDGLLVTSLARTAIDVSCGQPLERAVIALDHVRRIGVSTAQLIDARKAAHGRRGIAVVDRAIDVSTGASESPFESMSRVIFARAGLSRPELQAWLSGASGRRYRVDFFWREAALIGEADGMAKYHGDLDKFREEKVREDDLRLAGYRVVRWNWQELVRSPDQIVGRVRTAHKLQPTAP